MVLYISFMLHIEPIQRYTTAEGHKVACEKLRNLADALEKHRGKLSIQSEKEFAVGCAKYDNVLLEMEERGHEVGTHSMEPLERLDGPDDEKINYVKERRDAVNTLGIKKNLEICGGFFITN